MEYGKYGNKIGSEQETNIIREFFPELLAESEQYQETEQQSLLAETGRRRPSYVGGVRQPRSASPRSRTPSRRGSRRPARYSNRKPRSGEPRDAAWAQSQLAQVIGPWVQQPGGSDAVTRRAVRIFQSRQSLPVTGALDTNTATALQDASSQQTDPALDSTSAPPPDSTSQPDDSPQPDHQSAQDDVPPPQDTTASQEWAGETLFSSPAASALWSNAGITAENELSAEFHRGLSGGTRWAPVSRSVRRGISSHVKLAPAATCPASISEIIGGFPRYQQSVTSLPQPEQAKIDALAQAIRTSYQLGCLPVKIVWLVGHADRDPQRGAAFELKISEDRAQRLQEALIKSINDPSISNAIAWVSAGAGSAQMEVSQPRLEADRSKNRRVLVLTTPTPLGLEAQVELVLRYIQLTAAGKATDPSATAANSNFARVVQHRYFVPAGYLIQPHPDRATKVIQAIGRQNTQDIGKAEKVCGVTDMWEGATPLFNNVIPPALQARIQSMPQLAGLLGNIGAATEILKVSNRRQMSIIDVPFLLGENTIPWFDCAKTQRMGVDRVHDSDLQFQNSKNESQLMHWATGVRYSHIARETLRDLFLAYEKWHLEYFDVFGPDPINDMIAEEAGRYMAQQVRNLTMNAANYVRILDESFRQARAWVGALLRLKRNEIDAQIKEDKAPPAHYHWILGLVPPEDTKHHPYPSPSIRRMLATGVSLPKVLTSPLVVHYVELYALLLEADIWEKTKEQIVVSPPQRAMMAGTLDKLFLTLAIAEKQLGQAPISLRLKSPHPHGPENHQ